MHYSAQVEEFHFHLFAQVNPTVFNSIFRHLQGVKETNMFFDRQICNQRLNFNRSLSANLIDRMEAQMQYEEERAKVQEEQRKKREMQRRLEEEEEVCLTYTGDANLVCKWLIHWHCL